MRNAYDPRMLRGLRDVLSATAWDVVHTHGMRANLPVRLLFRTLPRDGRPCLFATVHSDLDLDYGSSLKVRAYGLLERGSAPGVDRIICMSDGLRRRLEERGYDPERLVTIHSGVELERLGLAIEPLPAAATDPPCPVCTPVAAGPAPTATNGPDHPPTIGTVARLVPVKDVGLLLETAARLRGEFPGLRVVVIGDGLERPRLEAAAAALDLADAVEFVGWVDDVPAALAGVDVFVLTSVFEGGVSLSVVEAMALGLPVVATDAGGVAEAVVDGVTGYLVPRVGERADIAAALADRVASLLRDPPARRRLGAAGAARVAAEFTVERAAEQTIAEYRACIARRPVHRTGLGVRGRGRRRRGGRGGSRARAPPASNPDPIGGPGSAVLAGRRPGGPARGEPSADLVLHDRDIVCVSSLDYDAPWTSKQQIMHRLAAANRVLYVEEPVTMLAPLRIPAHWRRYRFLLPQLGRPEPGLWTLRLPPVLPFGNVRPFVNRLNQRIIAGYIRWAVRRLAHARPPPVDLPPHLDRAARSGAVGRPRSTTASTSTRPSRGSSTRGWCSRTTGSSPAGPIWSSPRPRTCVWPARTSTPTSSTCPTAPTWRRSLGHSTRRSRCRPTSPPSPSRASASSACTILVWTSTPWRRSRPPTRRGSWCWWVRSG